MSEEKKDTPSQSNFSLSPYHKAKLKQGVEDIKKNGGGNVNQTRLVEELIEHKLPSIVKKFSMIT